MTVCESGMRPPGREGLRPGNSWGGGECARNGPGAAETPWGWRGVHRGERQQVTSPSRLHRPCVVGGAVAFLLRGGEASGFWPPWWGGEAET